MKRFLLVCLSALVSFAVWADSFSAATQEGEIIYYSTISDTEVEVTGMENLKTYTGMLTIPETVYNGDTPYTVTQLGYNDASSQTGCFEQSAFYAINLPETITYIEAWTFYRNTNLTSLVFPSKITVLSDGVCSGCTSLTSVTIPDGVTYIGRMAISSSGIVYLTIPNSVTTFGEQPFINCSSLLHVDLSENLTEITGSAFNNCSMLQDLEIPGSVKSIDRQAFNGCTSLSEVIINEGVESIELGVFKNCSSIKEIVLPSSVTSLGNQVFDGCTALESIVLPEGLTSISQESFLDCTSLKEISLPEGIKEIGYCAFKNCTDLSAVYSLNTTPPTCDLSSDQETVFDGVDLETCVLYVPCDYVDAYAEAEVWGDFVDIQGIDCQEIGTISFDYTVDPPVGEVDGLSVITFTSDEVDGFMGNYEYAAYTQEALVYDMNSRGDPITTGTMTGAGDVSDDYDTSIIITLKDEITEPGSYRVVIPEGSFYVFIDDTPYFNEEITLSYGIAEPQGEYTFDPEDGKELSSLSEFTVGYADGIDCSWNYTKDVTVTDEYGEVVAHSDDCEVNWPDNYGDPVLSCKITLDTTITAKGTYTVNIPKGYFVVGESYANSKELTITYYIDGSEDVTDGISSVSTNSEGVESIYSVGGQKLSTMMKGVNIVRMTDGSTKKVLKK